MKVVHTIADCRIARKCMGELALVATMGALHDGHRSLIEQARKMAEHVAVSIFVNPTQFGPKEDFTKYPRPLEDDLALCQAAGVDLVFNPSPQEMYPGQVQDQAGSADRQQPGARMPSPAIAAEATPLTARDEVIVDLPYLTTVLEGRHRPGHFRGVCQVVAKLFNIIQPNLALFGQKDFQQLRILQAMTEALDFPVQIIACPTLREADGLAMSSRNRYLTPEQRTKALVISAALFEAQAQFCSGIKQTNRLVTSVQNRLLAEHLNVDYVAAVDTQSLRAVELVHGPTLLAVAARVGSTRLIDNVILGAPPCPDFLHD